MRKNKSTKKRIISWVLIGILGIFSILFGIEYGKISHMTSLGAAEISLDEPAAQGKFNVLLLGVDKDGVRADTIMIFSVDNVNKTTKVLSVPRDTKITLDNGRTIKINASLGFKSREKFMIETIKTVTRMPIHYYCEVNFEGFIELIDILGGVDYEVPFDMNYDDPAQDLHIHLNAGMQHLDGQAAHDFVRFRHNNRGEGVYAPGEYAKGDIGRIDAQQKFLKEVFRQKMQPQYLLKAPALINAAYENVKTNFSISSALDFVSIVKSAESTNLESFVIPGEGRYIGGVSYYVYDPQATKDLILTEFGYPEDEAEALKAKQEAESQQQEQQVSEQQEQQVSEQQEQQDPEQNVPKTIIN